MLRRTAAYRIGDELKPVHDFHAIFKHLDPIAPANEEARDHVYKFMSTLKSIERLHFVAFAVEQLFSGSGNELGPDFIAASYFVKTFALYCQSQSAMLDIANEHQASKKLLSLIDTLSKFGNKMIKKYLGIRDAAVAFAAFLQTVGDFSAQSEFESICQGYYIFWAVLRTIWIKTVYAQHCEQLYSELESYEPGPYGGPHSSERLCLHFDEVLSQNISKYIGSQLP